MHAEADVRAVGERSLELRVRAADVEPVRLGENRGVAVRAGE
jgi:hypothetical protein